MMWSLYYTFHCTVLKRQRTRRSSVSSVIYTPMEFGASWILVTAEAASAPPSIIRSTRAIFFTRWFANTISSQFWTHRVAQWRGCQFCCATWAKSPKALSLPRHRRGRRHFYSLTTSKCTPRAIFAKNITFSTTYSIIWGTLTLRRCESAWKKHLLKKSKRYNKVQHFYSYVIYYVCIMVHFE